VLVSLSSAIPVIDEARYHSIVRSLGDMILFGQYFHQLFMKGVVERGLAPQSEGTPLSPRELQCLEMAARD